MANYDDLFGRMRDTANGISDGISSERRSNSDDGRQYDVSDYSVGIDIEENCPPVTTPPKPKTNYLIVTLLTAVIVMLMVIIVYQYENSKPPESDIINHFALKKIETNLPLQQEKRLLYVEVSLRYHNEASETRIKNNQIALEQVVAKAVHHLTMKDILAPTRIDSFKKKIEQEFTEILGRDGFDEILITEFVLK